MQALGVETLIPCVFNSCIPWKKHVKTLMLFELAEWKLRLSKTESWLFMCKSSWAVHFIREIGEHWF